MEDSNWVKRVVEEQTANARTLQEREAAEERRADELRRATEAYGRSFVPELRHALDEYHSAGGVRVRIETFQAASDVSDWAVLLRCSGDPALTWSFNVEPDARTARTVWVERDDDRKPVLRTRALTLRVVDRELLWDGAAKGPSTLLEELLGPWLRGLAMMAKGWESERAD